MTYTISLKLMVQNFNIVVVGCGGTGGFVAEGLCRLLSGTDIPIILIDPDRVEPHNLVRQNFYAGDVGKFKSQALAERLSRQFGRRIGFSVYPYMHDLGCEEYGNGLYRPAVQGIVIGCVDNAQARRAIGETLKFGNWWLDAGNGLASGQVLLGNANDGQSLEGSFIEESREVIRLPIPTWQLPGLLAPPTRKEPDNRDCAEAVATEEQGPVINQAMATLVLEFVHRMLKGTLTWMGAYIDLEAGTLQTVPAEPETVARMCGVKVDTLIMEGCSVGRRYSLERR
ncbi:MAG: ThiF family adenylyltransferase [Dehalococcoidales bacterium]|nr:ThiF family adenylyltransferase [Dehalococcoidales bacterium]